LSLRLAPAVVSANHIAFGFDAKARAAFVVR